MPLSGRHMVESKVSWASAKYSVELMLSDSVRVILVKLTFSLDNMIVTAT
jgi:hypothetical protein